MTEQDKATSENYIATAYKRAEAREGFLTYQIDTYALQLLLLIETESRTQRVKRFDDIVDKLALIVRMIGEGSHRYHAVKSIEYVEPFLQAREPNLDENQRKRLSRELGSVISALAALPMDFRALTGSDKLRGRISIFKDRLLAPVLSEPTTSRRT